MTTELEFKDLLGRPVKEGDFIAFSDSWNSGTSRLMVGKVRAIERTATKVTLVVNTKYTGHWSVGRGTKVAGHDREQRIQCNTSSCHCRVLVIDDQTLKDIQS